MTGRRLVALATALGSLASLGVTVATPAPAQAVFPSTNTIYRAQVVRGDGLEGRIRIVVAEDKKTVAKVWVKATCADGTTVKIVRRNLRIHRTGGFSVQKTTKRGLTIYAVDGAWDSKDVAFGEVDLPRCRPGGFAFLAER